MENQTAKNNLKRADEFLDSYEKDSGLPPIAQPGTEEELQKYLIMNFEDIQKFGREECLSIAFRLSQFAYYIQKLYNIEKSHITWSKRELYRSASQHLKNYEKTYLSLDAKIELIARENSYVEQIQRIFIHATQRCDRLTSLADRLYHMSRILENMKWVKNE